MKYDKIELINPRGEIIMSETNNQQNNNQNNVKDDVFTEVYKEVMELKHRSRGWSVASLVLGILSILCCCAPIAGVIMGALSITFAVISRISLGYFDGLSIAGLITSIFGIIFGVSVIIFEYIIVTNPEIANNILNYLERIKQMEDETVDLFARLKGLFRR